jgi:hypothetical protein
MVHGGAQPGQDDDLLAIFFYRIGRMRAGRSAGRKTEHGELLAGLGLDGVDSGNRGAGRGQRGERHRLPGAPAVIGSLGERLDAERRPAGGRRSIRHRGHGRDLLVWHHDGVDYLLAQVNIARMREPLDSPLRSPSGSTSRRRTRPASRVALV